MENKSIVTAPTEAALAELRSSFPTDGDFKRILLPRLVFQSQDKTEGKGKQMKVVAEAGTFYTEKDSGKTDENGKAVWDRTEIGRELDATICYQRKQLKFYDSATESFTSSPVYDEADEVVPLFSMNTLIARGTPAELKKKYEYTDADGKVKSKLEDNKILYVLYNGELYQLGLRGSSMWSFRSYARKTTLLPAQLTHFSSEERKAGTTEWNCMFFSKARDLNAEEVAVVAGKIKEVKEAVAMEKNYYVREDNRVAENKKIDEMEIVYPSAEAEKINASDIPF